MSALARPSSSTPYGSVALPAVFILAAAVDAGRTLRHAMWRDELQAFMLAAASSNPLELFHNLKFEGHPGLWHLLLWIVTRFAADPIAMQLLHIAIALSVWILIYRFAPFTGTEKLLLVLSYFLFWEYFVLSRSYVLMALFGFGFAALRSSYPKRLFSPWIVLGLLTNTVVFGTIWSMALGAFYVLRTRSRTPAFMAGAAIYGVLLALAVLTMTRSAGESIYQSTPGFDLQGLGRLIYYPLHAFAPGFDTGTIARIFSAGGRHRVLLILVLGLPVAMCWVVTRNFVATMEFAAVYVGVLMFALLWHFTGGNRHHGIVFLAFVGAVWANRAAATPVHRKSSAWLTILLINAAGGLTTLSFDMRPHSQGRNVANWIEQNRLSDALIIGSPDAPVSTVAGYLMRPIYYLECECRGTYVVWNSRRQSKLPDDEIVHRILRAIDSSGRNEALLILNRELTPQQETAAPRLLFEPQAKFTGAIRRDENYVVYRVRLR